MLKNSNDLGAAEFSTWSDEQRHAEIGKLVQGYRAGLPVGILCKMAETIVGSRELAREQLLTLMNHEERLAAVARESGGMQALVRSFLLTDA
jgi:hypothetical protein